MNTYKDEGTMNVQKKMFIIGAIVLGILLAVSLMIDFIFTAPVQNDDQQQEHTEQVDTNPAEEAIASIEQFPEQLKQSLNKAIEKYEEARGLSKDSPVKIKSSFMDQSSAAVKLEIGDNLVDAQELESKWTLKDDKGDPVVYDEFAAVMRSVEDSQNPHLDNTDAISSVLGKDAAESLKNSFGAWASQNGIDASDARFEKSSVHNFAGVNAKGFQIKVGNKAIAGTWNGDKKTFVFAIVP